jgi:hypothetical protein
MKIFLDDIRYPSVLHVKDGNLGWTIVRNYTDFVYTWVVNKNEVTHISFDHDLGEPDKTGYDCLKIVEEDYFEGFNRFITMSVHSNNPVGVEKMTKVIKNLELMMMRNHCK